MKIRVVKCENVCWWYKDNIGETFDVIIAPSQPEDYKTIDFIPGSNCYGFFSKSDCEVIAEVIDVGVNSEPEFYCKVLSKRGYIYYINSLHMSAWMKQRAEGQRSHITTVQYSELVIDTNENEIVKCEHLISDLVDGKFNKSLMTIHLDE